MGLLLLGGWATLGSLDTPAARTAPPDVRTASEKPGPAGSSASEDARAPDFTLKALDGSSFRLAEQKGKVVVINFWATWCPPCRQEIPDFIELQEQFGSEDVVFVGVSLDEGGPDAVRAFADEIGINYPVVIDDGSVSEAYGPIPTLPTTFLVGRDGTIQGYAPGMLNRAIIEPPIANLVANRPVDTGARTPDGH